MNWQVIKNRLLLWLRRLFLYGGYVVVVVLVALFLVLQLPPVQEALISRYIKRFSEVTGFQTGFSSAYLLWYDHLELKGLSVQDPENNTMIAAEELLINFRIASLLADKNINIDGVVLDGAAVNLVKIQESDSSRDLNMNVFIARLSGPQSGGGQPPKINIGEVLLNRSAFSYNDTDRDSIANGFDYFHFALDLPHAEVQQFQVIGDTIQLRLNALEAADRKTKLDIRSMQTYFRISQTSLEFLDLHLQAGQSSISDTVIFSYPRQRDLNDFNNKVTIRAQLRKTVLHPEDLALFAPEARTLPHPIELTGRITGRVTRFFLREMDLKYGNTHLLGKLSMDGLPALNETFITLQLNESKADIRDFQTFVEDKVYQRLQPLGRFQLNGTFTGFVNDFVANATLRGAIGTIRSDINLKLNAQNVDQSTYRGNLVLNNFDLGIFLRDTVNFQLVNLNGNINGRGLSSTSANFLLAGNVSSIGIRGYQYQNIKTNARLSSQFFNGSLEVDDPNLQFKAQGSIDFRNNIDAVNIKAQLDSASMHKIGLSREHLFIRSFVDINSRGLQLDSILGDALFKNSYVEFMDNKIELDSIHVFSEKVGSDRQIRVRSSVLDASIRGNYYYSTLFNDLSRLARELAISLKNDQAALNEYYRKKPRSAQSYDAQFRLQLHDVNPLIALAGADLQVSRGTTIEGRFANGLASILHANTHIDTLRYGSSYFYQNDLEFTGSKIRDSANVLALVTAQSARQRISSQLRSKNLNMEGLWNRDHVDLSLNVDQDGLNNFVRLRSEVDFLNDTTRIRLLPSRIQVLEKIWTVDPDNYLKFANNKIFVHQLQAQHGQESILIDGVIAEENDTPLQFMVRELNLNIINTLSSEKFSGVLNGRAEAKNLLGASSFQNNITIDSLTINDFLIGDVTGTNEWNARDRKFDINFFVDRLSERTVNVTGYFDPEEKASPLNMEARFNKANLQILDPVLRGIFSQIEGELSGSYDIRGAFAQPLISGTGRINGGKITIDYLMTRYTFAGNLEMTPTQFVFRDFELADVFNNKGSLNGYIAHKNFNKFRLNLDGAFTNLQVLNTTAKDNSLFYGQGYATGNVNIFGPASNLKISATGRTEKNSKIYIPISGTEETERKDFIAFTHFTDSLQQTQEVEVKKQTELTGITMDLNLDITPDAYAEIIFDIKAGDIIRGRGNGDIKLQLDTKGEFNMFGLIEFTEGAYNFTLYDIVNKEFYIKPGSRITWFGDPYQGNMNITAGYRQLSSLTPIYTEPDVINSAAIRRKYPFEVLLSLEGAMLSPQINFDIQAIDLPENVAIENRGAPVRPKFDFAAFKAKLDEQELKRQVFSLIVLRKLSPVDAFATGAGSTLANSVSEFLSNQLSYWLTQVDQNLEIDFDLDLGTLDQEAFNTFQLRLSYSFLNGRLRVTRDGTFQSQNQSQQSVASLAGDWTVDYLLTPDGMLKVKMYSRSNINAINASLGGQTAITTGVSLLHTQNFNEVKDLLRSARERRRRQNTPEPPEEDRDGSH